MCEFGETARGSPEFGHVGRHPSHFPGKTCFLRRGGSVEALLVEEMEPAQQLGYLGSLILE